MNVLFLLGRMLCAGGVEKITVDLANSLQAQGITVTIVCFESENEEYTRGLLADGVLLETLVFPVDTSVNYKKLRKILSERKVDIIINQWAVPWYVTRFIKKCIKGTDTKLISVHHSLPDNNSRIQTLKYKEADSKLLSPIYRLCRRLITLVSKRSLRYVYENSDNFVLLSESFKPILINYAGINDPSKISIIPNYIKASQISTFTEKQNEIIAVGRVDYNSKCTYRIVDIWKDLEPVLHDWSLTIIGDGPNFNDLKARIDEYGLSRVSLTGHADPKPYYKWAKILVHLSEYEGFGLVILEAMCNGVVPIVLNSFSSLSDIIKNDSLGIKLSYPYDKESASRTILDLIKDTDKLYSLSRNSVSIYSDFTEGKIVEKWTDLFNGLNR